MNSKVCCFNNRFILLSEAPRTFQFNKSTANRINFRQTINLYPNFIQNISKELEDICQEYNVVAILYKDETTIMNNFSNGAHKNITYYVYYTNMNDCIIDNVFYDELINHLTTNMKMTYYVAQVFLQSLRRGFNKPDPRIVKLIKKYNLPTCADQLEDIRNRILNMSLEKKKEIEINISKNSTYNSILPNMILLNVTNCIQQESLSIKHDASDAKNDYQLPSTSVTNTASNVCDVNEEYTEKTNEESENNDENDEEDFSKNLDPSQCKFKSYTKNSEFQQHYHYCSYGHVVIVEANMQMSTFNNLILKNLITAFLVKSYMVDQLHIFLYIDEKRFNQFSKVRIHGKILQYTIHNNFTINTENLNIYYNIDFNIPKLFSTAPLMISQTKNIKESFKTKVKNIQIYLIVCSNILHKILSDWNCICKILRIITSPYDGKLFYHTLVYINENETDFLYEYLPNNGMDNNPCVCLNNIEINQKTIEKLPHSQKLWTSRPCVDILFHTHFDWTILKIHNDFLRRQNVHNIFELYDIYENGKSRIAQLLESKVFKTTIENMTTFKFFNETGLLYPFEKVGQEELYIYILLRMTRIVYRCMVVPLLKLERLTPKNLLPSKFMLTCAFIDDPLTPTTSVRGPQSTRNLKSIEVQDKMFDTRVINVTMLMNSFNLCGSESIENSIKM